MRSEMKTNSNALILLYSIEIHIYDMYIYEGLVWENPQLKRTLIFCKSLLSIWTRVPWPVPPSPARCMSHAKLRKNSRLAYSLSKQFCSSWLSFSKAHLTYHTLRARFVRFMILWLNIIPDIYILYIVYVVIVNLFESRAMVYGAVWYWKHQLHIQRIWISEYIHILRLTMILSTIFDKNNNNNDKWNTRSLVKNKHFMSFITVIIILLPLF